MNCQHQECDCPETSVQHDGKSYCSEGCTNASAKPANGGGCGCGHPSCGDTLTSIAQDSEHASRVQARSSDENQARDFHENQARSSDENLARSSGANQGSDENQARSSDENRARNSSANQSTGGNQARSSDRNQARGSEGSGSERNQGGRRGLVGDGKVGDTRQRAAEAPGRETPDDAHRLSFAEQDARGAAMKPGAARQRGSGPSDDRDRASVRRNS